MRVGIATDHGGFGLKEELVARLREVGHEVVDIGTYRSRQGLIGTLKSSTPGR